MAVWISWREMMIKGKWKHVGVVYSRRKAVCTILIKEISDEKLYIKAIKTKKKFRGQGYAKLLIQNLFVMFPNKEVNLRIHPFGSNPKLSYRQLKNFYEKLGFKLNSHNQWSAKTTKKIN